MVFVSFKEHDDCEGIILFLCVVCCVQTLRLWDSLFADEHRFQYLNYVCVAMLRLQRKSLLKGSFSDNMKLLQVSACLFFFLSF